MKCFTTGSHIHVFRSASAMLGVGKEGKLVHGLDLPSLHLPGYPILSPYS